MKSSTPNSDSATKWLSPDVVHYIVESEQFQTQLRSLGRQEAGANSAPFISNWAFIRTMAGNKADEIWFIELSFLL